MLRNRLATILAALLLTGSPLWLTSCGSGSAKIRFVHALNIKLTVGVDVLIDRKVVVTNLPYGMAGAYLTVSSGTRTVELRPTGSTSSTSDVFNGDVPLQSGNQYTAVLDYNTAPNLDVFTDTTNAPSAGNARLRIIHASNFYPALDIYAVPGTSIGGLSPQLSNLPLGKAAYINLTAGSYQVFATAAGTQNILLQTGTAFPALSGNQIKTMVLYNSTPFYFVLSDLN